MSKRKQDFNEQYVLSRRERKKLDCKYAILRAAKELIAERGADVPVEEIAQRAGISYPTFFNYFPTKSSLYYAIYLEELEDVREFIDLGLKQEKTAARRIKRLLDEILLDFSRYKYLELYIAGDVVKRSQDEGTREQICEFFLNEIERGIKSGELRSDIVPRHYALLMTAMVFSSSFYECGADDYHNMLGILLADMQAHK